MLSLASLLPGLLSVGTNIWGLAEGTKQQEEAKAANLERYNQGLGLMDEYDLKNQAFYNGTPSYTNTTTGGQTTTIPGTPGFIDKSQAKYDENISATDKMFQDLLGQTKSDYSGLKSDVNSNYDQLSGDINSRYGSERQKSTDWYNNLYNTQDAAYGKRTSDVMGLLENMGAQQAKDINQSWKNTAGNSTNQMLDRGLTGSTLLSNMNSGITRDTNADLARLDEALRTQKAGTLSGLTKDQLDANALLRTQQGNVDQAWGGTQQGVLDALGSNKASTLNSLGQNQVNANQQIGGNRLEMLSNMNTAKNDTWSNLTQAANTQANSDQNRRLGWIQAREDQYPDLSANWNGLNQAFSGLSNSLYQIANPPQQQKSGGLFNWGGAGVGAGAGALTGATMGLMDMGVGAIPGALIGGIGGALYPKK
jgi:hypothetical protein